MNPPNDLLANRSNPDAREVLNDWRLSHGIKCERLGVAIQLHDAADAADADAADDAADAADADSADAADAADADDAARAVAADADGKLSRLLTMEIEMRDGVLYLITLPGGYYGRGIPRIGYVEHLGGDEWRFLPGARSIYRTGGMRPLDALASGGIGSDHRLSEPMALGEIMHRLAVKRVLEADPEAWPQIERPKGKSGVRP